MSNRPSLATGSLVSIEDLDALAVESLVARGEELRNLSAADHSGVGSLLDGRSVAGVFYENSTRTRVSFEFATRRLGGIFTSVDVALSSEAKGESLRKTFETLESIGFDLVVVRHGDEGVPSLLGRWLSVPVINAGDGCHEHPTQALGDLLTLVEHFGSLEALSGKTVGFVGDVLHSRVARSTSMLLQRVGMDIVFIGPGELLPRYESLGGHSLMGNSLDETLGDLDVVYMLRIQFERLGEHVALDSSGYVRRFQLNAQRLRLLKSNAVLMHPGPMNIGVEVDGVVSQFDGMLANRQVFLGTVMRMAVLERALGAKGAPRE